MGFLGRIFGRRSSDGTSGGPCDGLTFRAQVVEAVEERYTEECVVHQIAFGAGDPELGGQYWTFSRTPGDDDWGVCTTKEVQEVTVYGGITRLDLKRDGLTCEFDEETAKETGIPRLVISYSLEDALWRQLLREATAVFDGETYFTSPSE